MQQISCFRCLSPLCRIVGFLLINLCDGDWDSFHEYYKPIGLDSKLKTSNDSNYFDPSCGFKTSFFEVFPSNTSVQAC